jgi:GNAT superfamily N-acetyltransferase
MNIATRLYALCSRTVARWGELGCDDLLELPLQDDLPAVEPRGEVTLRQATPADIDEINRLYSSDPWLYIGEPSPTPGGLARTRDLYLDRLRRGEVCFLAMSGDAIAHVNWICFTWGDALPEHPIRLRAGEIYTTDAMTLPPFRGKGLHGFVLRAMLAHARARGARHAYTLARIDRTETYAGLYRVGYRKCGRVIYFLPRGRTKAWFLWREGNLEPLFRPA